MDDIPEIYLKRTLILGCGNILFGDDGFGPEVIRYILENFEIPQDAGVVDAGTGVRDILFDILVSGRGPERIVIVDALDLKREAGEVLHVSPEEIPLEKREDYSLHQFPSSNLLKEISKRWGIEVEIVAVQVKHIPEEVETGLSPEVNALVPVVGGLLRERYLKAQD